MILSVKQIVVRLFDGMYGLAHGSRLPGGLLLIVLTGACLVQAAESTGVAQGLSSAIEELRAAKKAWKDNEQEFNKLQRSGGASNLEVNEFAEFVDGLKRQVLDGCREVRALGGNPEDHVAECESLEKDSRQASQQSERQKEREQGKRQADRATESSEVAGQQADKGQQPAKAGQPKTTEQNQASQRKPGRPLARDPNEGARQASRSNTPAAGQSQPNGSGRESRKTGQSASAPRDGNQGNGPRSGARQPATASKLPDATGARARPQSKSEDYQSQLKALEAELDGYLNTQLSKVRDKARSTRQSLARGGTGGDHDQGVGAAGTWGGGESVGANTQPKEPGVGPGVQKGGPTPRWDLPEGVGDGSDDDVVARQLREAAQAETDPETRRRLWEEYKKYKGST